MWKFHFFNREKRDEVSELRGAKSSPEEEGRNCAGTAVGGNNGADVENADVAVDVGEARLNGGAQGFRLRRTGGMRDDALA